MNLMPTETKEVTSASKQNDIPVASEPFQDDHSEDTFADRQASCLVVPPAHPTSLHSADSSRATSYWHRLSMDS